MQLESLGNAITDDWQGLLVITLALITILSTWFIHLYNVKQNKKEKSGFKIVEKKLSIKSSKELKKYPELKKIYNEKDIDNFSISTIALWSTRYFVQNFDDFRINFIKNNSEIQIVNYKIIKIGINDVDINLSENPDNKLMSTLEFNDISNTKDKNGIPFNRGIVIHLAHSGNVKDLIAQLEPRQNGSFRSYYIYTRNYLIKLFPGIINVRIRKFILWITIIPCVIIIFFLFDENLNIVKKNSLFILSFLLIIMMLIPYLINKIVIVPKNFFKDFYIIRPQNYFK